MDPQLEAELYEARHARDVIARERDQLKAHLARLAAELEALRSRTWVEPGHFYSPLVDPTDPRARDAMLQPAGSLPFRPELTLEWLERVAAHYPRLPWGGQPADGWRFGYENPAFSYSDAITLFGVLLELRPRRYVECGCGWSSCAFMDVNDRFLDGAVEAEFIDPHPQTLLELLAPGDGYRERVRALPLQDVPLATFEKLDAGDVLFLDTSHVGKTGSDVLDYLFRVLPALAPGVVVHIHDIFYPFEYFPEWVHRSWNEAYLVRAFLEGNADWEIFFWNDWVYRCNSELIAARMPLCLRNRGGSLWLRRK